MFYFGNAIGEAGNSTTNAFVTAGDEIATRNDPHSLLNPAPCPTCTITAATGW